MINIDEICECPHCKSNLGYYIIQRVSGIIHDNHLFGTKESYNSAMHDGLKYKTISKYYYCIECNKKISKITN